MKHIKQSRWSSIVLLVAGPSIISSGWVGKTHSCEVAALPISQGLIYAATLAGALLWRACVNPNHSAVDRVLQQEIHRLTAPHGSSNETGCTPQQPPTTANANSAPLRAEYVHPTQSAQPIASVSTHPCTVDVIDNPTGQALCHVDRAYLATAIYCPTPEITSAQSQKLIAAVSIDWQTTIARISTEAVQSAHAHIHRSMIGQLETLNPVWTAQTLPNGGTIYHAPNEHCYVYFGPSQQTNNHTLADWMMYQDCERFAIHRNPYLYHQVSTIVEAFIDTATRLIYGGIVDRVVALLHIGDFFIDDDTHGQELNNAQMSLYAAYCHKDGSICMQSLGNMIPAKNILLGYPGINRSHKAAFLNRAIYSQNTHTCNNLFKKARKVDLNKIYNNSINQCCIQMLHAFAAGNMEHVAQIKNNHTQSYDLDALHLALQQAHDQIVQQQERLLYDADGIMHFNIPIAQRDPVYNALSSNDHARLKRNATQRAHVNDILKLRHLYKNALHTAWHIPTNADPVVHQALYALIESDTIPDRIDKIHELTCNQMLSSNEQRAIVTALFLPNGIVKDFAQYERAQTLQMPSAILLPEHSNARALLNHLVHLEHLGGDLFTAEFEHAIASIQNALNTDDKHAATMYLANAEKIYAMVHHHLYDKYDDDTYGDHHTPATHSNSEEIPLRCGTGSHDTSTSPFMGSGECLPEMEQPTIDFGCCGKHQPDMVELPNTTPCIPDREEMKSRPCNASQQSLPSFGIEDITTESAKNSVENSETKIEAKEDNENDEKACNQTGEEIRFIPAAPLRKELESENIIPLPNETLKTDEIKINELANLSDVLVKVEGRGNSNGRTTPNNLLEKLAMSETMSNPKAGKVIPLTLNNPIWPSKDGWIKMQQVFTVYNATSSTREYIVIHYVYNEYLDIFDDFKFK